MVILKIKWAGSRDWQSKVFSSMKDAIKYVKIHDLYVLTRDIEFEEVKVQKRRKK